MSWHECSCQMCVYVWFLSGSDLDWVERQGFLHPLHRDEIPSRFIPALVGERREEANALPSWTNIYTCSLKSIIIARISSPSSPHIHTYSTWNASGLFMCSPYIVLYSCWIVCASWRSAAAVGNIMHCLLHYDQAADRSHVYQLEPSRVCLYSYCIVCNIFQCHSEWFHKIK